MGVGQISLFASYTAKLRNGEVPRYASLHSVWQVIPGFWERMGQ